MTTHAATLSDSIRRLAKSRRRYVLTLAVIRSAGVGIAFAVVLLYLDVLLQLTPQLRLALLFSAVFAIIGCALFTRLRFLRTASEPRMIARLVEQAAPALHNDVINALEFEEVLASGVGVPVSRPLMAEEVATATRQTATLQRVDTLEPPSLRKEACAVFGGVALLIVLGFVFINVVAAVVPRYLDPFGDHPPYSPTAIALDPAGLTVDYGDNVTIRGSLRGPEPEEIVLVLNDGTTSTELPMLRVASGEFQQTIERVRTDLEYFARFERGRSKRYSLEMSKVPRIDSASVTYRFPAYTKLPPRTRQLGEQAIVRAYAGTEAEIALSSNRPLSAGTLTVSGQAIPMGAGDDEQTVAATITIDAQKEIVAKLVDVEGTSTKESVIGRTEVQPDEIPRVAIVSPGRQSFAIPTAQIPIEIEAQDDLGIAEVRMFRAFNGSNDYGKPLFNSDGGEVEAHTVEVLDLADLGVRPGDTIDFYVTVTDTLPSTPQTAATAAYQITIISEEQFASFMQSETSADELSNEYNEVASQLEAVVGQQQAIESETSAARNALSEGQAPDDEAKQKLSDLAARQAALAKQAQAMAESLRQQAANKGAFDIEKEFKKTMQEMAERLSRAQELMKKGGEQLAEAAKGAESAKNALQQAGESQKQALEQMGQGKKAFEDKIEQPMNELERMYKLLENVETYKQIYQAQENLARQSRPYRDVQSPSLDQQVRLKELAQAQQEIRYALIDLRNNFDKHAAEIEPDMPNVARDARRISDGIDGQNIPTVMERATGSLGSGDGKNGHAGAEEARKLLDEMIDRVKEAEGSSSQAEQRLRITMGLDPGNTLSQMKKSMKGGFKPSPSASNGSGGSANASQAKFDMFGPKSPEGKDPKESSVMSSTRAEAEARSAAAANVIAGSFEEMATPDEGESEIDSGPSEPVIEEYRGLIDAYFQRIADEN